MKMLVFKGVSQFIISALPITRSWRNLTIL